MKFTKKLTAVAASAVLAASSIPAANLSVSAADHNYMEALAMSLYFFDSNACGKGITDGPLTWRGDCHTYDSEASVGSLDGSLKAVVDPDGDGKVDVSGGWHDAGDHIKFNLTIGFAMSSLGMSDYFNPGIYEKAGCRDHLEYELRWGADYLMKTTFLDDNGEVAAIAHTVAEGGTDHSFWTSPEVQTYDRPVYWLTASSNNSAVSCEMACGLLGAAYVLKESDPTYSAECIKYAKALLKFGTTHIGNDTGGIGGFYSTDAQYQDEEALAKAWLWILGEGDKPTRVPKDKNYGDNQYDGWIYTWDKVWQGYSALMYKATGDTVFKDELILEMNGQQGGLKVGSYNTSGWGTSRHNCALQMDAYLAADGDPDSDYAKGAKWQLDYILGDNNLGYSFLLGFGDKWPSHIHHRAANPGGDGITSAQNPSAKYTNYGMLVGGIDGSGYEDHADRYQYTEGALDYNGSFAIACSFAAALYGGDASTFDAVKKSADEINDSFKFAEGDPQPPVPSETTTTTVTTTPETQSTTVVTTVPGGDQKEQEFTDVISEIGNDYVVFKDKGRFTVARSEDLEKFRAIGTGKTVTVNFLDYQGNQIMVLNSIKAESEGVVYGDANCDGKVSIADSTAILQHLGNQDKYGLSEQGLKNADIDGKSGVTTEDSLTIQMIDAKLLTVDQLPLK